MLKEEMKYSTKEYVKDLWRLLGRNKGQFILLTSLLGIASLLALVPSIIVAKTINFFTNYNGGGLASFYWYLGILLIVGIVATFIRLGSKHYFGILGYRIQKNVRLEYFQKLMEGDLVWHDKENTGNKMEKIGKGVSSIGSFMSFYLNRGIDTVVSVVGIIIVFTYFDLKYALLTLVFITVYISVEFFLNKKFAEKTYLAQIATEQSSGNSYEFSSNITTVKSLGIEKSLNDKMLLQEEKVLNAKNEKKRANTQKWITVQVISSIFYVIFLYFVGKDVVVGAIAVGYIVIYVNYVVKIQGVLNDFSNSLGDLTDIKYSIKRMIDINHSISSIRDTGTKTLRNWNSLSIKNLSFGYKTEEVLNNFNLTIKKGEKIGLVGRSGSGKSTLFKLLLRLYLPKEGMIYFDSHSIVELKKDFIVDKISIIPQETELFNLSFKDNILLARNDGGDYVLYKKALLISQCLPILSKLKDKDATLIGEKGIRLSGGERQRLGIARGLYKDSDIIIFDESSSNLDYATEKKIQDGIDKHLKDKTLIISAHRLSTLKNMDRIIVLDRGKIGEEGTYDQLVKKKGIFYDLLRKQDKK